MSSLPVHTSTELRARRLIAQLLAPSTARPHPTSLAKVASYLTAVQAQNAAAGRDALALRLGTSPGSVTPTDLAAAGIVRSWSQRGTHHLLPLRDVRWITLLCSPRVQRASAKRRGQLGLTDADVDRCREALLEATATPVTRTEAYEIFRRTGVNPQGGRGPHMLRHFGGEGEIIQGLPAGTEDTFIRHDVLVEMWRRNIATIPSPAASDVAEISPLDLTGEDALCELGVRYFRSRGPATVKDFSWWTGLTTTDAKKAATLATGTGSVIAADTPEGDALYLADWQADVSATEMRDAISPRCPDLELPAFDEYLMAYTDRSAIMTNEVTAIVGPTKNGLVYPCVAREGIIIGRS